MRAMDREILAEVFVDEYTGGLVGPGQGFAATIKNGGVFAALFHLAAGADDYCGLPGRS